MTRLEKSQKEFLYLLLNKNEALPIQTIQNELNIGRRTIYYSVNKLNELFFRHGIDPITNKRGSGYFLTDVQKQAINKLLLYYTSLKNLSPKERIYYLICWIMYPKASVHIENIVELFDVSRNSVFNDLKNLKIEIEKYDISLCFDLKKGYSIGGQTFSKRAILLYYLKILLKKFDYKMLTFLDHDEVKIFYDRLKVISLNMHNAYDDYNLLAIACLLNIIHYVDEQFDFSLLELKDLEETKELCMIDKYFQDLNVHERLYLAIHLLGSKAGNVIRLEDSQRDIQLFELALHLVNLFERQTLYEISEKNELINSLYMHFKLSMYYFQLSIQMTNSLLEDVKENYRNLYQLLKNICEMMKDDFPFLLTDSEISYITMHFGGHLKQVQSKFYAAIRVLIVCPSGISTSILLKKEVEDLYANVSVIAATTADNIEQYKDDFDFAISTIDLYTDQPWIKVSPILSKDDKSKIASMLAMNIKTYKLNNKNVHGLFSIIAKYVSKNKMISLKREVYDYFRTGNFIAEISENDLLSLSDILYDENIIFKDEDINWQDAIQLASKKLLKCNIISESYINEMIKLVKEYGPYIILKNKLALAHAKPQAGVSSLGISLLINKKGIYFDNDICIHYLFVMASPDAKASLQVLRDISLLASSESDLDQILYLNKNKIIEYIKKLTLKSVL